MIERAILTAGIVIFIIGGLARLGESAVQLGTGINCAFAPSQPACKTAEEKSNGEGAGTDTSSNGGNTTRNKRNDD